MRKKTLFTVLVLVVSGVVLSGCGRKPAEVDGDTRVVARINNYELTSVDLKNEIDLTSATRYLAADPARAKEEFLEDMIIKKILIQEAQKQNFDKDKAFMKEIERYWEQALLKLLIKKKTKELLREVGSKEEAQKELEKWIDGLRDQADVTVNREVLEKIELKSTQED
ncbi:MAG: hypothetical protein U9R44_03645 [Candidatus Omnitrophota bacterium]|nr:hypothetical protein [Candidatus Omnitrophota bacterium]